MMHSHAVISSLIAYFYSLLAPRVPLLMKMRAVVFYRGLCWEYLLIHIVDINIVSLCSLGLSVKRLGGSEWWVKRVTAMSLRKQAARYLISLSAGMCCTLLL